MTCNCRIIKKILEDEHVDYELIDAEEQVDLTKRFSVMQAPTLVVANDIYPEGSTRNTNPCFQPTRRAQALELLAKWGDLTEKYDCTMAQLVIAMTARMIPGLHVLCGARKPEQVLDNAGALHIKLDGADAVRMKWDVDAIS